MLKAASTEIMASVSTQSPMRVPTDPVEHTLWQFGEEAHLYSQTLTHRHVCAELMFR